MSVIKVGTDVEASLVAKINKLLKEIHDLRRQKALLEKDLIAVQNELAHERQVRLHGGPQS